MAPPPTLHERGQSSNSGEAANYKPFRSKDRMKPKQTDLLCRLRYSNNLPEIPFYPKFLSCPFVDLARFVEYKQTTLEKNYKFDLLTEPDLGVKIDLINPDTYLIDYKTELKMDPLDERLLEEEHSSIQDSKRSQQHSKIVPWMRKTEYISSEYNRYGTHSERQETKVGYNIKKLFKEDNLYRDRASQIQAISRTFEEAKRPLTQHYSKPGVHAVQEMPIFPDFELWKYPFAQVIFDSDPSPVGVAAQAQIEKMAQALIRGMMDESGEQFVAYFLPTEETLEKRKRPREEENPEEEPEHFEYKLAREYNWTVKNKATKGYEENYFLAFRGDSVCFNELETRVRLSRRRAKEGQPRIANSRLVVTHRDLNDQEVAAQDERLMELQQPAEEEEMQEPEPDQSSPKLPAEEAAPGEEKVEEKATEEPEAEKAPEKETAPEAEKAPAEEAVEEEEELEADGSPTAKRSRLISEGSEPGGTDKGSDSIEDSD